MRNNSEDPRRHGGRLVVVVHRGVRLERLLISRQAQVGDAGHGCNGGSSGAGLVGPGCADYAKAVPDGAGSVSGMSQDPVATAASNNPLLKTLVQAVSGQLNPDVNLVDTLNGDEFTVFAPVDDAFAKLDPGDRQDAGYAQGCRHPDECPDVPRDPGADRSGGHRRNSQDGQRRPARGLRIG